MNKEKNKSFVTGHRIIWDSGFGYEIGRYIGESTIYNCYEIDLRSGLKTGPTHVDKSTVFEYSTELVAELTAKYGYEKKFSETF